MSKKELFSFKNALFSCFVLFFFLVGWYHCLCKFAYLEQLKFRLFFYSNRLYLVRLGFFFVTEIWLAPIFLMTLQVIYCHCELENDIVQWYLIIFGYVRKNWRWVWTGKWTLYGCNGVTCHYTRRTTFSEEIVSSFSHLVTWGPMLDHHSLRLNPHATFFL